VVLPLVRNYQLCKTSHSTRPNQPWPLIRPDQINHDLSFNQTKSTMTSHSTWPNQPWPLIRPDQISHDLSFDQTKSTMTSHSTRLNQPGHVLFLFWNQICRRAPRWQCHQTKLTGFSEKKPWAYFRKTAKFFEESHRHQNKTSAYNLVVFVYFSKIGPSEIRSKIGQSISY